MSTNTLTQAANILCIALPLFPFCAALFLTYKSVRKGRFSVELPWLSLYSFVFAMSIAWLGTSVLSLLSTAGLGVQRVQATLHGGPFLSAALLVLLLVRPTFALLRVTLRMLLRSVRK